MTGNLVTTPGAVSSQASLCSQALINTSSSTTSGPQKSTEVVTAPSSADLFNRTDLAEQSFGQLFFAVGFGQTGHPLDALRLGFQSLGEAA